MSSSSCRPRGWIPPPPPSRRRHRWIPPLVVIVVVAAATAAGSLLLQISLSEVWYVSHRAWCGVRLSEEVSRALRRGRGEGGEGEGEKVAATARGESGRRLREGGVLPY
jgi:hypothetical protein